MNTSEQHRKTVDFVNQFKEANKNTVQRVRSYDPKQKTWTLETVKIDPNVKKFARNNLRTEVQHRFTAKKKKNI